jgi:hypothetical protein
VKKGAFLAVMAVLAAALLAFAGCGGGDETTALTKAEFTKQVNAGCKEHQKEREELFKKVSAELDPSEVTRADQEDLITEVLLPPFEKDIENMKSLAPPEGDEKKVEAIIEAMEKAIKDVEAKPLVALRSTSQFAEARALFVKYGLDDCLK